MKWKLTWLEQPHFLSFFLPKISEASTVLGSPTLELQRSPVAVQIYIHADACMCLLISIHLFLQELFTVTLHWFTFLRSQSLQDQYNNWYSAENEGELTGYMLEHSQLLSTWTFLFENQQNSFGWELVHSLPTLSLFPVKQHQQTI